jgi:hypothetical protein
MTETNLAMEMLKSLGINLEHLFIDNVAKIQIHQNKVVGLHLVPGLKVEADELSDELRHKL